MVSKDRNLWRLSRALFRSFGYPDLDKGLPWDVEPLNDLIILRIYKPFNVKRQAGIPSADADTVAPNRGTWYNKVCRHI